MPMTPGLAQTPMVDEGGFVSQPWQIFFRDQDTAVAAGPVKEVVIQPAAQNKHMPPYVLSMGLAAGLYRLTASVRISKPATTSSSVLVSIFWRDGSGDGVSCSLVLVPPVTGNTIASVGTGTALIHSADKGPLSVTTTYASAPDLEMEYLVNVVMERLGGI